MAQQDIPTPLSQPQILGEMLDSVTSRIGIRRFKVGSPILSILESVSQSLSRSTYGVFQALQSKDVDNIEGIGLQRIGADEKIPQFGPIAASTIVTITDTRYSRIAANLYHGQPAPIVGSTILYVDKTTTFLSATASGVLYIGRGTAQQEGPLVYTSKVDSGNYWTITLSTPTAAFHNQGEEVVIGQGGDRNVNAGQIVSTPAGALSTPVQYSVLVGGVLADGETELNGISVICLTPGVIGNVPEGAISDFGGSPPFTGAAVTNPNRVTDGRDSESAKDYRTRIKNIRNSKTKGTDLAIKTAALNVTSPDEQKTVLSSSLLRRFGKPSVLYIDDGNGYEPIYEGVGYEVLRALATGGETDFKTIQSPIVKASVESVNAAPYTIPNGATLSVSVGFADPQTHTFDTSIFNSPQAASAYDVVSSINSNTALNFGARVSSNTTRVTLFPKEELGAVFVTGGSTKDILGFPTTKSQTLLLFLNDRPVEFFNYTLDRATGTIILTHPLAVNDRLTLGSLWTKAFLESSSFSSLTVASDQPLWFVTDGNTTVVDSGKGDVTALTVSIYKVTPSCIHLLVQNNFNFDSNVEIGQNLLLYQTANNSLPAALVGNWKIIDKPALNQVVIEFPAGKSARKRPTATVLPSTSNILVCGGLCSQNTGALASTEIYNSTTGAWTSAAPMGVARYGHTATALGNGKVLVVGGCGVDGVALASTELYDPSLNTWTAGPTLSQAVYLHTATLLSTGNVLICGGISTVVLNNSVEYATASNTLVFPATFTNNRFSHTSINLPSNDVMMVGGFSDFNINPVTAATDESSGSVVLTCNKYSPSSHTWSALASVPVTGSVTRFRNYVAEVLNSNTILAVADQWYYTYSISGNAWTSQGPISTTPGFSATEVVYNGTSITEATPAPSTFIRFLYFGRSNQLVKTAGGTLILPFAELSNSATGGLERTFCHVYYNSGTSKWAKITSSSTISGCKSMFASAVISNNIFVFGGQEDSGWFGGGEAVIGATVETIDGSGLASTYLCPVTGTYTGIQGWAIYNTSAPTTKLTISANTYSPQSLSDALIVKGAAARVYQTSKIRLNTNDNEGDLIQLGPTVATFETEALKQSGNSLSATVKASRSELDMPADFSLFSVGSIEGSTIRVPFNVESTRSGNGADGTKASSILLFKNEHPPLNGTLCGLTRKNFLESRPSYDSDLKICDWPGATQSTSVRGYEWGNFKNEIAQIGSWAKVGSITQPGSYPAFSDSTALGISSSVALSPNQPFYCGLPFKFSPTDKLSVVVDQNTTSGFFSIPMSRKVAAANSTYGSQITINDAENSHDTLAKKFGVGYSFNNFDVLMKARNKVGNILYRFYRPGAEGENYIVRYLYPTAPAQQLSVTLDHAWLKNPPTYSHADKTFININLPSGAAYTNNTITPTTRLNIQEYPLSNNIKEIHLLTGFQVTQAERTTIGDQTALRIQYPDSHLVNVFSIGDVIRYDAITPTPTTLLSGQTIIVNVGSLNTSTMLQDIYLAPLSLDDGTATYSLTTNPGTISLDPAAIAKVGFDPTISTGDIAVIGDPQYSTLFNNNPIKITAIGSSNQYLKGKILGDTSGAGSLTSTPATVSVFRNSTATESSIVASVNALATAAKSACPITATLLSGGSTVINAADWDTNTAWDSGTQLVDGYNAVLSTALPGSISVDHQVVLKRPTASNLATNSDWQNEEIYLLPAYASDVVRWLNTPCITGLWSQALIEAINSGTSIQITSKNAGSQSAIQVSGVGANQATAAVVGSALVPYEGGPAFIVSVNTSGADGFRGGDIVKIVNTVNIQKPYSNSIAGITVTSVAEDGTWTISGGNLPFITAFAQHKTTTASFEKAGNFAVIKLNSPYFLNPDLRNCGQYIYITTRSFSGGLITTNLPLVHNANKGVFKIVNVTHNGSVIWIENPTVAEEKSVCDFNILDSGSLLPGDTIVVTDDRFGAGNKGSWTIDSVGSLSGGAQFINPCFKVSIQNKTATKFAGSKLMNIFSVQVVEANPGVFYKKILGINPNQANSGLTDIKLCDMGVGYQSVPPESAAISISAGSIIESTSKPNFPNDLNLGIDAYKYHTGLVGEVNKVLYGTSDTQTYPGFVANGASVLVDGPVIKRIQRAFAIRSVGNPSQELADRVKSIIAGVINSSPHGENISVSDMVSAASKVDGVDTVTPLFEGDQVILSASEKGMVLNPQEDISVIFLGV